MITFVRNGVVVFDFAWLVNPYTWTGKIGLGIGLPVLTKVFLQSDFYRNNSPFTKAYNQKLRAEIETKLPDNLPNLNPHQQAQAFPALSFEGIANLQKEGFIHVKNSSEMPASFQITVTSTQKTYQIFNTEQLGAGAFGEAFIGQDTRSGEWVAVKMQPLRNIAKEQDVLIENSYLLADRKLLGQAIYEKNGDPYLLSIMPLFVKDSPRHCSSSEKIDFLMAVANELKRLHQKNKIHSDLHLGNVCWNKAEGIAHLIDYGSIVDTEDPFDTSSRYVPKLYTPPESLFGLGLLHVKAGDIYSLGCMARQLFENTNNARLKSLISKMQHSLFFMRPSLDVIIGELVKIKVFANDLIEKPLTVSNNADQECLNKVHEEIAQYKLILQKLDAEIAILKDESNSGVDYIHLAMKIKEKSIYQKQLQRLIGSIELFHQFQIPIKPQNIDELQKDLKQLVTLKSDYQPSMVIEEKGADFVYDELFHKTLLMQFDHNDLLEAALAKGSLDHQQTDELSKNKKNKQFLS